MREIEAKAENFDRNHQVINFTECICTKYNERVCERERQYEEES